MRRADVHGVAALRRRGRDSVTSAVRFQSTLTFAASSRAHRGATRFTRPARTTAVCYGLCAPTARRRGRHPSHAAWIISSASTDASLADPYGYLTPIAN